MYFRVIAKCGNLGKKVYVPISFAVKAPSREEAVVVAKSQPYVRKDLFSPIISVTEIDKDSFNYLSKVNERDPFFKGGWNIGRLMSMFKRREVERESVPLEFA